MKRFDKRYIYSSLLTDFFSSLFLAFAFLQELLLSEESGPEELTAVLPFFAIGYVAIFLCFVAYRILFYRTSGYELTETEIRCNRGVLFRRRSVLEYKKVHAVNKKQNIVQRLFGVAVLTVDSGSANTSHQAEITIIERNSVVDALLDELHSLKEAGGEGSGCAEKKGEVLLSDQDSLYRFTSGKKMLYTLINIASALFFTALFAVLSIVVIGLCKGMLRLDSLGTWGEFILYAILISAAAMLVLSVGTLIGSVLHSFVGYYGFSITRRGESIQISYGLLQKQTNTFSYDRIKAVKISQGLVQRILGFASIRLEVIGYTVNGGDENKAVELGVLVPFCKYDEIGEILGKVLPEHVPSEKQTEAVAFFPFVSWFLLIVGAVAGMVSVGTAAVMAVLEAPAFAIAATVAAIGGVALLVVAFKLTDAALSYRTNGLAVENGKITVYSGGLSKTITVFMAKHLVAVENVTTPMRKKHGIASIVMHLKTNAASNEVKVHIQKDALSEELEKRLIV